MVWLTTFGMAHVTNIDTRSARHVVGGGVAGAEPPHKGGPNRPDRPNCSGQWLVVSGQRRRFTYFRVESGLDMAPLLREVQESSPQYWDEPLTLKLVHGNRFRYNDGLDVDLFDQRVLRTKRWHDAGEDAATAQARPIPAASANCAPIEIKMIVVFQRLPLRTSPGRRIVPTAWFQVRPVKLKPTGAKSTAESSLT